MRKLILSILFSVLYVSSASAELGVNVGVSGNAGLFTASANEKFDDSPNTSTNQNGSEHGEAVWPSIFIEKTLGDVLFVGVDYVPAALETETAESARSDKRTANSDAVTASTNKIQVDFEDLTSAYLGVSMGNFYAKVGMMTVEVITNENLGTGGAYANTDLDGTVFGVGFNHTTDNGAFVRVEGNYMDFDGATLANSNDSGKKITLSSLDGVSGKISIGKSF